MGVRVSRGGQLITGSLRRVKVPFSLATNQAPGVDRWGVYTVTSMYLRSGAPKGLSSAEVSFTHPANAAGDSYSLYSAPTDSQRQPRSAYGLTTLFQGRTWHEDLGL
jgi:hypothetical protein